MSSREYSQRAGEGDTRIFSLAYTHVHRELSAKIPQVDPAGAVKMPTIIPHKNEDFLMLLMGTNTLDNTGNPHAHWRAQEAGECAEKGRRYD